MANLFLKVWVIRRESRHICWRIADWSLHEDSFRHCAHSYYSRNWQPLRINPRVVNSSNSRTRQLVGDYNISWRSISVFETYTGNHLSMCMAHKRTVRKDCLFYFSPTARPVILLEFCQTDCRESQQTYLPIHCRELEEETGQSRLNNKWDS